MHIDVLIFIFPVCYPYLMKIVESIRKHFFTDYVHIAIPSFPLNVGLKSNINSFMENSILQKTRLI